MTIVATAVGLFGLPAAALVAVLVGIAFAALGVGAERLASVWPAEEAKRRRPGLRTVALGLAAGLAGGTLAWRSTLPAWATAVHLAILALLVLLTATDLEQHRLPHVLLDPLFLIAALFVPFNPSVDWTSAVIGAWHRPRCSACWASPCARAWRSVTCCWWRRWVCSSAGNRSSSRSSWPRLLSAVVGIALLVTRRAGMRTYIPFGPFLVIGTVVTLLRDPDLLGTATAAATLLGR